MFAVAVFAVSGLASLVAAAYVAVGAQQILSPLYHNPLVSVLAWSLVAAGVLCIAGAELAYQWKRTADNAQETVRLLTEQTVILRRIAGLSDSATDAAQEQTGPTLSVSPEAK